MLKYLSTLASRLVPVAAAMLMAYCSCIEYKPSPDSQMLIGNQLSPDHTIS